MSGCGPKAHSLFLPGATVLPDVPSGCRPAKSGRGQGKRNSCVVERICFRRQAKMQPHDVDSFSACVLLLSKGAKDVNNVKAPGQVDEGFKCCATQE